MRSLDLVRQLGRDCDSEVIRDDSALPKLFPVSNVSPDVLHNVLSKHYNEISNRWTTVPATVETPKELQGPLENILNGILISSGISTQKYLFLPAYNAEVVDGGDSELLPPDFLLVSTGPQFVNTDVHSPVLSYATSVSPVQLTTHADIEYHHYLRRRLTVPVKRMFTLQWNRRFVIGLQFTERYVRAVMYDHHGVMFSFLNYHKNPDQFVALVLGLATDSTGGFDTHIFRKDGLVICRISAPQPLHTLTPQDYVLDKALFRSSFVCGRGTICWKAHAVSDPSKTYIIKDVWIYENEIEGREVEGVLLAHAQACGLNTGVVQLHHFERVRQPGDSSILDTLRNNRQSDKFSFYLDDPNYDMFHHRLVMSPIGKPLEEFATGEEFLCAFYDAVLGHRRLHEEAGILHRDISPVNIMINSGGENGNRGFLIDLDHASRVPSESEFAQLSGIGTTLFMSRNVLRKRRHTYFDDLESFFYVYLWIICGFEGPGVPKQPLPDPLDAWGLEFYHNLNRKQSFLEDRFSLKVSSYFTKPFRFLAFQFYKFFRQRSVYAEYDRGPSPASAEHYEEFLGYIRQAIESLTGEESQSINSQV